MASTGISSSNALTPVSTPPQTPAHTPEDVDQHLSYPSFVEEPTGEPSTSTAQRPRQVLKDRLYIGNLHPTVDEYSLLQIFSKFGKVTKLDFLFHKTGALKGKPRGYAFIEFANQDDALKALTVAHDKLIRGRKLVVTYAHQAPLDQGGSAYGNNGARHRKTMAESGRPTTLSMLKSGLGGRHDRTNDKIAMMEAKLRQMEGSNTPISSSWAASTSSLPHHPSLPSKPPPALPADQDSNRSSVKRPPKIQTPLPSLPILPQSQTRTASTTKPLTATSTIPSTSSPSFSSNKPRPTSRLAGVKLVKSKEKRVETDG